MLLLLPPFVLNNLTSFKVEAACYCPGVGVTQVFLFNSTASPIGVPQTFSVTPMFLHHCTMWCMSNSWAVCDLVGFVLSCASLSSYFMDIMFSKGTMEKKKQTKENAQNKNKTIWFKPRCTVVL